MPASGNFVRQLPDGTPLPWQLLGPWGAMTNHYADAAMSGVVDRYSVSQSSSGLEDQVDPARLTNGKEDER
ncbi:hypothetical protein E6O75_ATG04864 [Venturia nashicola]|uniref:Uncharacterized protein n=1 Tax=Venturia nashicola TaxID=86259 RepID=A0A4Z1PI11_9PEZI|nr:hypothetical protein E6O75_ATG04864 [Venturia nashicola]